MTKIMIVDNDPSTVKTIKAVLEYEGYKVITAYDGQECLGKLKEDAVDLILLDIMMPYMDGIQVCSRLATDGKLKDIPIITISALSMSAPPSEEIKKVIPYYKNVKDHISKPFDIGDLVKKVKKVLDGKFHERIVERLSRKI